MYAIIMMLLDWYMSLHTKRGGGGGVGGGGTP